MGPIGAILAIPASLLVKALLVDMDPDAKWLELFLGDEPVFKKKKTERTQIAVTGPPDDVETPVTDGAATPPVT
jgi:hypothetical protein